MMVWYDVVLCPPPEGKDVLAYCDTKGTGNPVRIGKFRDGKFMCERWHTIPTYWMPLPKLPKEMQNAQKDDVE